MKCPYCNLEMEKSRAEAYHCEKCKTVIIPYGEDSKK